MDTKKDMNVSKFLTMLVILFVIMAIAVIIAVNI